MTDEEVMNELKRLALLDWPKFLQVSGVDVEQIKICSLRGKGRSLASIAVAMGLPKSTIRDKCKKCTDNPHTSNQK